MGTRKNYYKDPSADYSKSLHISAELSQKLIEDAEKYIALREDLLPATSSQYTVEQIEKENKAWWPTHCEALRKGRGDLLAGEYANELVYLCADGPFYGRTAGTKREANWWAIIAQPGVTMIWPIVLFHGEVVYFEWKCIDDATDETVAKGSVTWQRRGHRGGCYLKCEQLTFYRDVYAPEELMAFIKR